MSASSSTSSQLSQSQSTNLASLGTAFGIQVAVAAGVLVAFTLVLRPSNKTIYEPRSKFAPERKKPVKLPSAPSLQWLPVVWTTDLKDQILKIGLDAVMFLRFIGWGIKYFTLLTFFGTILMLVHAFVPSSTSSTPVQSSTAAADSLLLSKISINQIPPNSPLFYIHSTFAWVFAFWAYYSLFRMWQEYSLFRGMWFSSDEFKNSWENRLVVMTDLPDTLLRQQALTNYLKLNGAHEKPNQVVFGRDVSSLSLLVQQHEKYTKIMERAVPSFLRSGKRIRPTHTEDARYFGLVGGHKVDTIDFCIKRLRELERQIYHARSKGDNLFKLDRSAFLSFDTIAAAHSVAKKLESLSFQRLVTQEPCVKLCPQVDNISWEHIGWAPAKRRVHSSLGLLIILGIIIGWTFLTAFVVGLSQISNLKKVFPNIDPRQPFVEFVVSLLSPVLTALLNSVLLPIILYAFTKFQGIRSESGTNKSVLVKYFSFLLYSIIFTTASVIGGTAVIFNSLTADSATGSALIATGFTLLSPFWISYIAAGYAAYSLELAQAWPLITNFINRRFFKNTPRRRFELNQAPELWYSVCYGSLLFTFTIGALYSLAAPLITPFVLFSFIVAYFVFKYQLLYVYETKFESGGSWFPVVFNLICTALIFMQIVNTTILIFFNLQTIHLNGSAGPVTMVAILPVLTLAFAVAMNVVWAKKSKFAVDGSMSSGGATSSSSSSLPESSATASSPAFGGFSPVSPVYIDDAEFIQLKERVFNPALAKPLFKVWVKKNYKSDLDALYEPEFASLEDYILKQRSKNVGGTTGGEECLAVIENTDLSRASSSQTLVSLSDQHSGEGGGGDGGSGEGQEVVSPSSSSPSISSDIHGVLEMLKRRVKFIGRAETKRLRQQRDITMRRYSLKKKNNSSSSLTVVANGGAMGEQHQNNRNIGGGDNEYEEGDDDDDDDEDSQLGGEYADLLDTASTVSGMSSHHQREQPHYQLPSHQYHLSPPIPPHTYHPYYHHQQQQQQLIEMRTLAPVGNAAVPPLRMSSSSPYQQSLPLLYNHQPRSPYRGSGVGGGSSPSPLFHQLSPLQQQLQLQQQQFQLQQQQQLQIPNNYANHAQAPVMTTQVEDAAIARPLSNPGLPPRPSQQQ